MKNNKMSSFNPPVLEPTPESIADFEALSREVAALFEAIRSAIERVWADIVAIFVDLRCTRFRRRRRAGGKRLKYKCDDRLRVRQRDAIISLARCS